MRVLIAAIGKARSGPEQALYSDYTKRLPWKVTCHEYVAKAHNPSQRTEEENQWLIAACKGYDRIIALDESGKLISSMDFAKQISVWQQEGHSSFAFVIGGSDGLNDAVRAKANLIWSLGKVTWPHMLVRALLAEQLYRAYSVLTNHPYHREG